MDNLVLSLSWSCHFPKEDSLTTYDIKMLNEEPINLLGMVTITWTDLNLEDNSDLLRQEATSKLKVKPLACVAKVGSVQAKVVLLFDLVNVPILDLMKPERYAFKV